MAVNTMRLPFIWLIALRFLREGRLQTVLILSGITAGVAIIIFLSELMSQLESSMIERVLGAQAHVIIKPLEERNKTVLPPKSSTSIIEPRTRQLRAINQWSQIITLVESLPQVRAVSPLVSGPAFAIRGRANRSVAVMGVDSQRYQEIVSIQRYMRQGRFEVSGNHAIIGVDLANDLGAKVGDKIFLRTAEGRDDLLQVTGIFDIGVRDLNRRWVFTSMRLAQNLLDIQNGVSSIDVTIDDIFKADQIAQQVASLSNLTVENWMASNTQMQRAIKSQASSSNLIRFFITLVVALGIASVLTVSVVQKQKEIGILRAMGAGATQVMRAFLLQGGLLGLGGACIGIALAWIMLNIATRVVSSDNILYNAALPIHVAFGVAVLTTLVGLLAAWLPARQAARLEPARAIHL